MNQQPQNEYLRVNKHSKNIRKSHCHQLNDSSNPVPQPKPKPNPQEQVYITNKSNFKALVQRLTSSKPCERLPQNLPKHQKMMPEPINPDSTIPPSPMAVQEDPDVSLYMSYLQSVLEESSGSNGDQFQQPFDEYHSHMLAQPQFQPQAPNQSNGDHFQQPFGGYHSHMLAQDYSLPQAPNQSNGDHFQQPFDGYHSHMLAQAHLQPQVPNQSNGDHFQQPFDEYHSHMLAQLQAPNQSNGDHFQQPFDEYHHMVAQPHFQPQAPNQSYGDHFQQPFDKYHSHMLAQAYYSLPQAPNQSMPQSNGVESVIMPATIPSSWFNGSLQQMQDAYSLQSTRIEYPQPLTPNLTFSAMNQPGDLGPDLDCVGPEIFEVPFEIE